MKNTFLLSIYILLSSLSFADMFGPRESSLGSSGNGNLIARVDMIPNEDESHPLYPMGRERIITLHRWNPFADDYEKIGSFSLGIENLRPHFILINDGGDYVAVIDISNKNAGFLLYSLENNEVHLWKINQILDEEMIDGIPLTGSSTQWFEDSKFDSDSLVITGPSRNIKGLGSHTVMDYTPDAEEYEIKIDLITGETSVSTTKCVEAFNEQ